MTDLDRSARTMTLVTIASRLSGFVRVAVFANVFGRALLANTYQLANTVPNILFELFAAGALQAVLVPTMVRLMPVGADGRHDGRGQSTGGTGASTEAERVAGTVLTVLCGAMALLAALAMIFGHQIMTVLAAGEQDPATRAAEVRLGTLFLYFFMPQLVFYGANVVATAVLNARGWFSLPVFAPLLNNIVVVIAYLWIGVRHHGQFSLELSTADLWILAGGTTLAVVVFCMLPIVGTRASGFRLRPHVEWRHPAVRALASEGAWAGLFLAVSQVTQLVMLRLLNREPGGPSAFQYAFILFTLPHSLFAVPIMTTRFPTLARASQGSDWVQYRSTTAAAVRAIGFMGLLSAALTVAVAEPALRVVSFGNGVELAPQIALAAIAFAPGVVGYGLFLFFTRAMYALGDQRSPALVNVAQVVVTSLVMVFGVARLESDRLAAGLALVFGLGHLAAAAALGSLVVRRLRAEGADPLAVWPSILRNVMAAVIAGGIGFVVARQIGWSTRAVAVAGASAAAIVVAVAFTGVQWASGGLTPRLALKTLGAGE